MEKKFRFCSVFICGLFLLIGCTAVRITGKAVGAVGKVAFGTAKIAGKTAWNTAKFTGKGLKTVVDMATGRHVVKLDKKGNSLYVDVLLNRKVKTKLIVDTGCTDTQISSKVARDLGLKLEKYETVACQLADGRLAAGKAVNLKEVRVGRAKVYNVRTIVLEDSGTGRDMGLLGMSFLDNFIFRIDSEKGELILHKRSE